MITASGQNIFFNKVQGPSSKNFYHITGMVQDKQGYMWLATKNGLFRYDGYQMKQYKNNPLDANSLGSDHLETICVDKEGILWIGTFSSGLDRFDPATNRFRHYRYSATAVTGISSDSVLSLCATADGNLWVGTIDGLNQLAKGSENFTRYKNSPADKGSLSCNEVRAIYEDRNQVLWIGTGSVYGLGGDDPLAGGLNRFNPQTGKFTRYVHDAANPRSIINNKVRAIFEDSKGNFWIGTAGDGLHTLNRVDGSFTRYTYNPTKPRQLSRPPLKGKPFYDHITFITEDAKGAIWIGSSESGINYYNTKTQLTTHFEAGKDTAGSYKDYTSWWACRSREGVLWISTIHGNLYRVNPLEGTVPFVALPNKNIAAICRSTDKTLWIGTARDGLYHTMANGALIKKYERQPEKPGTISSSEVSCILQDSDQRLWAGTFDGGLNLFNPQTESFTIYRHNNQDPQSLCNNTVLTLYDDAGKDLWVGTYRGLSRLNRSTGKARHYFFYPGDKDETGRNIVTSVLKDRKGSWWAGCWARGGVQQFDPVSGKFTTYLAGASIISLMEDQQGVLWAGGNEGLYHFNRELQIFQRFEDPAFLTESNIVQNLLEDNTGTIWMTTTAGIVKLNRERNETTLFGKSYGINGNEFTSLSGYKDTEGKLYFGCQSGYFTFLPGELARGMRAPDLVITSFQLANKEAPLPASPDSIKKITLGHNENIFSFGFTGIDYSNPEENRHLFMLENYDQGWNLAGSDQKAVYFNVPPGRYVFRVKVVNSYGVWTQRNIDITITPPWWTTWWFRIGSLLFIAALFYLIVRWRVRQKFNQQLERSEKDKQLAELRQKTGELEMQALRAQMNPHFVFNSLNAINNFILQNNKSLASEYLTKFSRLVRMILQNSQSTLITLESELDALRLYLELEVLRFDNRFAYTIDVQSDMDTGLLKVPPLIIQPYAENAIWHGLMHKEEKGNLLIDIRQEGNLLLLTIQDDGVGRQQASSRTAQVTTKHKSLGLKITADRIANLQRTAASSPVTIHDLQHPDGTAAGTKVILQIPVIYD